MNCSYFAKEIWRGQNSVVVDVKGQTQYRVRFTSEEARVIAPGLDVTVELDDEIHPLEDLERAAVVVVAQLEGGMEV